MSRYQRSKSGLFLMELLINLLLFCVLCGCGLMFFIKSTNLTEDTTTLHHAVSITSSIAGIFEDGNGDFASLENEFQYEYRAGNQLYIYYDKDFQPCEQEKSIYYVIVTLTTTELSKIDIEFYDSKGDMAYSITACHFHPTTIDSIKEVTLP